MTLISANDLHALSAAHRSRKPLTLTRTLQDATVTVRTLPASEAWGVNYLVQIRVERGRRTDIQTFESVEAIRRAWGYFLLPLLRLEGENRGSRK